MLKRIDMRRHHGEKGIYLHFLYSIMYTEHHIFQGERGPWKTVRLRFEVREELKDFVEKHARTYDSETDVS